MVIENSKSEIADKLKKLSDFSRIDYLERCLMEKKDLFIKTFCHHKLAEFYSSKRMFGKAAQHIDAIARLGTTYNEKLQYYMEVVRLLVEAGDYHHAVEVFDKTLSYANNFRRVELKKEFLMILRARAERLEGNLKRAGALEVFEVLYRLSDDVDKKWIKQKLIKYYEMFGKSKELARMRA